MNFKKRIKIRLYVGIIYILLGIAMIVSSALTNDNKSFFSSFGLAFIVMGLVKVRNYKLITKNENTLRKQEIAETDERSISIVHKARSTAFTIYILCASLSVIVLALLKFSQIAMWISYAVALLVLIYWICYLIYNKIS